MVEVTEEESKEDTFAILSLLVHRYELATETNLILPAAAALLPFFLLLSLFLHYSLTPGFPRSLAEGLSFQ